MRETIFAALGQYLEREGDAWLADLDVPADTEPGQWIDAIAARRDLVARDAETDIVIAAALEKLPKDDRRTMPFAYPGYPLTGRASWWERAWQYRADSWGAGTFK